MDNIKNDNLDVGMALAKALAELQEELKPVVVKFNGSYMSGTINVQASCMENEQILDVLQKIFFDLFYYLDVNTKGMKYSLNVTTFGDPSFAVRRNSYLLETTINAMPDTGGVTREQWQKFKSQMVFTRNGVPVSFPDPEPFFGEDPDDAS